jgi:uncharacterized protein (DUF433 family)
MTIASNSHILVDERGIAWIEGTRTKVMQIAVDHIAGGMSPWDIHLEYPPLTLAQIHAALAYYFDHQAEVDAQIRAARDFVAESRARYENTASPAREKLRQMGIIK